MSKLPMALLLSVLLHTCRVHAVSVRGGWDSLHVLQSPGQGHRNDGQAQQLLTTLLKNLQRNPLDPEERLDEDDAAAQDDDEDYPTEAEGYGLLFEEDELEQGRAKRANENVEQQYGPQSVANLLSIIEELGRNLEQKQQDGGAGSRVRNAAYEEEWIPVEERMETEEEEEEFKDGRDEVARSLDQSPVGRRPPRIQQGPDQFSKLVDYYLLKGRKNLSPRLHSLDSMNTLQLMELSRKLQIHPADLVYILNRNRNKHSRLPKLHGHAEELFHDLLGGDGKLVHMISYSKSGGPAKMALLTRRPEDAAEGLKTRLSSKGWMHVLSPGNVGNQKHLLKHVLFRPSAPNGGTVDEAQLARFLTTKSSVNQASQNQRAWLRGAHTPHQRDLQEAPQAGENEVVPYPPPEKEQQEKEGFGEATLPGM